MRAVAALFAVKNKSKLTLFPKGSWGTVASSKERQGWKNNSEGKSMVVTKEKSLPIVAFSKPPPLPPLLGPLAVFSLLEAYLSRDENDN